MYVGKVDNVFEGGLSIRVVCDLCYFFFDDNYYVIYMDNFFSSVVLCKKLKGFGTYSVGILRVNRKDYLVVFKDKVFLKKLK